jgi:hypothetical protein
MPHMTAILYTTDGGCTPTIAHAWLHLPMGPFPFVLHKWGANPWALVGLVPGIACLNAGMCGIQPALSPFL